MYGILQLTKDASTKASCGQNLSDSTFNCGQNLSDSTFNRSAVDAVEFEMVDVDGFGLEWK